jgi:hypothetical protein
VTDLAALLRDTDVLSEQERQGVLGANARRLLDRGVRSA